VTASVRPGRGVDEEWVAQEDVAGLAGHQRRRPRRAGALLVEPKDRHEGLVDTPLLLWAHSAHKFTESPGVHSAYLFNQDAGGLPEQVDLGTERRRPSAA